jgi:hypothetical protein
MSGKLTIQICSDVDYKKLVAEIYSDERFVALLSQDDGVDHLKIEFPEAHNALRAVQLEWLLDAIEKAKAKLLGPADAAPKTNRSSGRKN